ncbi:hypothetical protein H7J93_27905 [Mycobacterium barrassiae]|uniref:hypothetical protein n=1 Tax=Mycobacterium barrassiae TaxID=319709 RepID=UPI002265C2A2|nr:hypothetical protein [Mycobacterium barrassiae]MCV7303447.1 hypothetical protein [Mycobacterium barrassiae]
MTITTHVVHRSLRDTYRRHGYFFRVVAILTIAMGVGLHVYRILFGDALTLQYAMTPTTDKILLIPMTYAAITGIVGYRRMAFANGPHKVLITVAIAYIALSVPLHVYFGVIKGNVDFYLTFFPMWFSWFLLILPYPAFLTAFAKLHYKN